MAEKEGKETISQAKPDFIRWFSELNKNSGNIAGGKGANLAEIYNLKLPVPPGFAVTAQAYAYFIDKAGINHKINAILNKINYEDTAQLDKATAEIRELIIKSDIPKEMQEEIIESYENLGAAGLDLIKKGHVLDILSKTPEPVFVAVRSSATAEDLADASFAGQQETFLNIKGNKALIESVKKCFASLFTSRATYYRNKKGFKHENVKLAVVIQRMIDSDKSGVIFTKDPTKKNDNIIIEAVFGLGEGIVSGQINPDTYTISREMKIIDKKIGNKKIALTRDSSGTKETVRLKEAKAKSQVLNEYEIKKLADYALVLEEHYKKPQDIEFAIENEGIYLVQTRPITTLEKRREQETELQGEIVLNGLAASPGVASGKIKIIHKMEDLPKINQGDIMVTEMTNPDMVVSMQKAAAIVTDEGGMTAHAAIISREMGIPCVVGTGNATQVLKENEIITVDGYSGKVYKGKIAETKQKEILQIIKGTKTKIKVIVDLPSFAERASKSGITEIGLTRIEGIIAESGKHPAFFLKQGKIKEYEEIIFKGIEGLAKYFDELWIRTSDIRTDEFKNLEGAPKEIEANPMLGMHGIRYSLKNPEIFKAELNALKRVAKKKKIIGLILPQVVSVDEIKRTKEILNEIDFNEARVGVMIETPAAVQIIEDLCKEGISFISFGTNDLTQYTLAIDRGNEEVQFLFYETNSAVLNQLSHVIDICKIYEIETSICGQAGSKKEMVKFLVKRGIDSISVNADMAHEISKYIKELESPVINVKELAEVEELPDIEPIESGKEAEEEFDETALENIKEPEGAEEVKDIWGKEAEELETNVEEIKEELEEVKEVDAKEEIKKIEGEIKEEEKKLEDLKEEDNGGVLDIF